MHGQINLAQSMLAPMTPAEMERLLDPFLIFKGSLDEYHPAPVYNEPDR